MQSMMCNMYNLYVNFLKALLASVSLTEGRCCARFAMHDKEEYDECLLHLTNKI